MFLWSVVLAVSFQMNVRMVQSMPLKCGLFQENMHKKGTLIRLLLATCIKIKLKQPLVFRNKSTAMQRVV